MDQMDKMKEQLSKALDQGAIGLSTGLIYPPGSFTSTEELIELTKIVGVETDFISVIFAVKAIRCWRPSQKPSASAAKAGSVQISHFKAARQSNWAKSPQAIELIRQAQSQGLDITADLYPYRAGGTSLTTLLPEWAHVGGSAKTLQRLANPENVLK